MPNFQQHILFICDITIPMLMIGEITKRDFGLDIQYHDPCYFVCTHPTLLSPERNIACIVIFTEADCKEEEADNFHARLSDIFPTRQIVWCYRGVGHLWSEKRKNVTWVNAALPRPLSLLFDVLDNILDD